MKLEHQVCSLELSKRLKELGFQQKSIFVWEVFNDNVFGVKFYPNAVVSDGWNHYKLYSAFTVAELGEMLPANAYSMYGINDWTACYDGIKELGEEYFELSADTEANARAKMLSYLLENKLMDIP